MFAAVLRRGALAPGAARVLHLQRRGMGGLDRGARVRLHDRRRRRPPAGRRAAPAVPAALVAPFGSVLGDRHPSRSRARARATPPRRSSMGVDGASRCGRTPRHGRLRRRRSPPACSITLTRPVHNAILPELAETPEELTASNAASSTLEGLGDLRRAGAQRRVDRDSMARGSSSRSMSAASVISALVTVHLPLREVDGAEREDDPERFDRRRPRGVRPAPRVSPAP